MRLITAMFAASLLSSTAWAQAKKPPEKVWTAAPVPGILPSNPPPTERDGSMTGTDSTTPFSSMPLGAQMDSRPTDLTRDGSGPGTAPMTPDLSR